MKLTKKLIAFCLAAVAMTMGLASCTSSDSPGSNRQPLLAFMTYEYGTAGASKFNYQNGCNNPVVSLTSNTSYTAEQLPFGSRVVSIFYAPGDTLPTKDATIEILQMARVPVITPSVTEISANPEWGLNPISLTMLTLQTSYLDMITTVNATDYSKIKYEMLVDQTTLSSEVMELYIVDRSEDNIDYGQSSQFYVSFDIAQLRNASTKVFRVHLQNATVPSSSVINFDAATGQVLQNS